MTNAAIKPPRPKPTAPAPARPATPAEAAAGLRSMFEADRGYKAKSLAEARANFDRLAQTDILDAIGTYAGPLARATAIAQVWDAAWSAYLPEDTDASGDWAAVLVFADKVASRMLIDAADSSTSSNPIRNAIDARRAAGRAEAVREIRDMATFAIDKLAAADLPAAAS